MTQDFFIRQNSVLPVLRMAPIDDGRYDFNTNHVLSASMQDASAYFTMKELETGRLVISNAPAEIKLVSDSSCSEFPVLEYDWKERDVKRKGTYVGYFEIKFNGEVKEEGYDFPNGNIILPVVDDLIINII